jgi:hypothetical protein
MMLPGAGNTLLDPDVDLPRHFQRALHQFAGVDARGEASRAAAPHRRIHPPRPAPKRQATFTPWARRLRYPHARRVKSLPITALNSTQHAATATIGGGTFRNCRPGCTGSGVLSGVEALDGVHVQRNKVGGGGRAGANVISSRDHSRRVRGRRPPPAGRAGRRPP